MTAETIGELKGWEVHRSNFKKDFIMDTINILCSGEGLSAAVIRSAPHQKIGESDYIKLLPVTTKTEKVTCKRCLKIMRKK